MADMVFDWNFAALQVAASILTALAALLVVTLLPARPRLRAVRSTDLSMDDIVFLFDDDLLIDATPKARRFLAQGPKELNDWNRLTALLGPRFPGFATEMSRLAETGMAVLEETAGRARLVAKWAGGVARITIQDDAAQGIETCIDAQSLTALNTELETLRQAVSHVPTLVWQQDEAGNLVWANRAYLSLVEMTLTEADELVWPLPRLFDTDTPTGRDELLEPRRISFNVGGKVLHWFDCMAVALPGGIMFFALPADATVRAEASLRDFRQTLTKTFANLPIGLAVFNRARQLVLFNPALTDLSALEPEFLIGRPSLFAFLDRLRDKQMIPEPKDYRSWRQEMASLEQQARNGEYQATWTLPSGQTYRVTGRPHPDGAIAFLFEDISAEVSLTRRFRAELEIGQAVFDSLDEAVAVFSPAGVMTMSNAAYAQLWGTDPSTTLGETRIHDASQHWQVLCKPTSFWSEARDHVSGNRCREGCSATVVMKDGASLLCRIKPIAGGATLVGFTRRADDITEVTFMRASKLLEGA